MNSSQTVSWDNGTEQQTSVWQSEGAHAAPKNIVFADDFTTADSAYVEACAGTGLLYRGDFQNAKQLLSALSRRVDRNPLKRGVTWVDTFHRHRARQIGRANITNKILVELVDGKCNLGRAPDMQDAVQHALGDKTAGSVIVSLRELTGILGAFEWRRKGVFIPALNANIHADYGVYSPIRGEYLKLIDQAEIGSVSVAWDIGTGTGVIAALFASKGIPNVVATDTSDRAIQCAKNNIQRLQLQDRITVTSTSLFPEGKADLIVCNPPWLPAKATSSIEHAVYDPKSQMLKGFLSSVATHLNPNGEAWLVMSNLAEIIGLRTETELSDLITSGGLVVKEKRDTAPVHAKAQDRSDPLFHVRSKEVTSMYRLQRQ
ncbi:MAG: class I SAM-dependent methyltransferase [Fuerstiella sp.]